MTRVKFEITPIDQSQKSLNLIFCLNQFLIFISYLFLILTLPISLFFSIKVKLFRTKFFWFVFVKSFLYRLSKNMNGL
jgi:hypothetical protein